MRSILLFIVGLLFVLETNAQSPEKMSYQAVIRNASNALVTNQSVGMQISILQTSPSGTAVYVETHTPTTNANGLVSIEIGTGTVVSGSMSTIDWSAGPYFIQTETDPTGGTTYTITGTSQLMSVPYALHSKTATTATNVTNDLVDDADADPNNELQTISRTGTTVTLSNGGGTYQDSVNVYTAGTGIDITNDTINAVNPTYTIGLWPELGGYVFWVSSDGKHGLVAETQDQGFSVWYGAQDLISNPANHSINGQKFRDWRLPTKYELNEMFLQRLAIGGFASGWYWSSTEFDNLDAWYQYFFNGNQTIYDKNLAYYVRAIRAF